MDILKVLRRLLFGAQTSTRRPKRTAAGRRRRHKKERVRRPVLTPARGRRLRHRHVRKGKRVATAQPPAKRMRASRSHLRYGIPKGHRHEAELKIAEKRTDTEEVYAAPTGKVMLKVRERGVPELGEGKPKHTFYFNMPGEPGAAGKGEKGQPVPRLSKREREHTEIVQTISGIATRKRDQNLIITNLDILLDIVMTMGKVRIDDVARALRLDEKVVEELARILEENSLISVHYPAFGKIELRRVHDR